MITLGWCVEGSNWQKRATGAKQRTHEEGNTTCPAQAIMVLCKGI